MNRRVKMFAVVVASAVFAAPFAAPAFAYDRDYRRDYDYRDGRYRDRDRDDHRHDYRRGSSAKYVVVFHVDGGRGRHKAKDRFRAAEIVDQLCRLGVDAHVHDGREVHYRFRGEGRAFQRSHDDAHLLVERLRNWGFHADVVHR